jgi:hypothetical protein
MLLRLISWPWEHTLAPEQWPSAAIGGGKSFTVFESPCYVLSVLAADCSHLHSNPQSSMIRLSLQVRPA